jgi:hypothetical protein
MPVSSGSSCPYRFLLHCYFDGRDLSLCLTTIFSGDLRCNRCLNAFFCESARDFLLDHLPELLDRTGSPPHNFPPLFDQTHQIEFSLEGYDLHARPLQFCWLEVSADSLDYEHALCFWLVQ